MKKLGIVFFFSMFMQFYCIKFPLEIKRIFKALKTPMLSNSLCFQTKES